MVIEIKAKNKQESFAYSRPVFVGGMRYIKINEISTDLNRIERTTYDSYQKYMMEHVGKTETHFRSIYFVVFSTNKKLI